MKGAASGSQRVKMKSNYKHSIQKLTSLQGYKANSRTHSQEQIEQIMRSMEKFGFTNPILIDEKSGIIAGHGRAIAAGNLGIEDVPCITITGLNQHDKAALVISDNKLAENAGWNFDALKSELGFLHDADFDLGLTGFSLDELADLLDLNVDFEPATEEEQGQLDQLDPLFIDCPHCGKEFDYREYKK